MIWVGLQLELKIWHLLNLVSAYQDNYQDNYKYLEFESA